MARSRIVNIIFFRLDENAKMSESNKLTIKQKLLTCGPRCEPFEIDTVEGKVTVWVRGMNGIERADFIDLQASLPEKVSGAHIREVYPYLVKKLVTDPETHEPIFGEGDDDLVLSLDGFVLEAIAKKALELSGLSAGAEKSEGNAS